MNNKHVFQGRVVEGRGAGAQHISENRDELQALIGKAVFPGTLNIVFNSPVFLIEDNAIFFDKNRRMAWPITLNETPCWAYRWKISPLHITEVISEVKLREHLELREGSKVTMSFRPIDIQKVSTISFLAWQLIWRFREPWYYKYDRYNSFTEKLARALGATQDKDSNVFLSRVKK